ncbi:hypothetical protein CAOG_07241 [Capsaspora owczarzaki ATCC 30864]|nr:hypothetical protein CAOG_07241 [Capsaspora owczarzaki ATCC 30864]|eukprot:XP_004343100.1 hypothetical protein CAOG_07241 [Capsaspora owczarzaki ATCC 30864]
MADVRVFRTLERPPDELRQLLRDAPHLAYTVHPTLGCNALFYACCVATSAHPSSQSAPQGDDRGDGLHPNARPSSPHESSSSTQPPLVVERDSLNRRETRIAILVEAMTRFSSQFKYDTPAQTEPAADTANANPPANPAESPTSQQADQPAAAAVTLPSQLQTAQQWDFERDDSPDAFHAGGGVVFHCDAVKFQAAKRRGPPPTSQQVAEIVHSAMQTLVRAFKLLGSSHSSSPVSIATRRVGKLVFAGTPIGDKGLREVFELFHTFLIFDTLDISNCNISGTGLSELALHFEAWRARETRYGLHPVLRSVVVHSNPGVWDESALDELGLAMRASNQVLHFEVLPPSGSTSLAPTTTTTNDVRSRMERDLAPTALRLQREALQAYLHFTLRKPADEAELLGMYGYFPPKSTEPEAEQQYARLKQPRSTIACSGIQEEGVLSAVCSRILDLPESPSDLCLLAAGNSLGHTHAFNSIPLQCIAYLDLSNNLLDDSTLSELARLAALRVAILDDNLLAFADVTTFLSQLPNLKHLQHVSLNANKITAASASNLTQMLRVLAHLGESSDKPEVHVNLQSLEESLAEPLVGTDSSFKLASSHGVESTAQAAPVEAATASVVEVEAQTPMAPAESPTTEEDTLAAPTEEQISSSATTSKQQQQQRPVVVQLRQNQLGASGVRAVLDELESLATSSTPSTLLLDLRDNHVDNLEVDFKLHHFATRSYAPLLDEIDAANQLFFQRTDASNTTHRVPFTMRGLFIGAVPGLARNGSDKRDLAACLGKATHPMIHGSLDVVVETKHIFDGGTQAEQVNTIIETIGKLEAERALPHFLVLCYNEHDRRTLDDLPLQFYSLRSVYSGPVLLLATREEDFPSYAGRAVLAREGRELARMFGCPFLRLAHRIPAQVTFEHVVATWCVQYTLDWFECNRRPSSARVRLQAGPPARSNPAAQRASPRPQLPLIVLFGKSRAGKSTLINSVFRREVAQVATLKNVGGVTQANTVHNYMGRLLLVDTKGFEAGDAPVSASEAEQQRADEQESRSQIESIVEYTRTHNVRMLWYVTNSFHRVDPVVVDFVCNTVPALAKRLGLPELPVIFVRTHCDEMTHVEFQRDVRKLEASMRPAWGKWPAHVKAVLPMTRSDVSYAGVDYLIQTALACGLPTEGLNAQRALESPAVKAQIVEKFCCPFVLEAPETSSSSSSNNSNSNSSTAATDSQASGAEGDAPSLFFGSSAAQRCGKPLGTLRGAPTLLSSGARCVDRHVTPYLKYREQAMLSKVQLRADLIRFAEQLLSSTHEEESLASVIQGQCKTHSCRAFFSTLGVVCEKLVLESPLSSSSSSSASSAANNDSATAIQHVKLPSTSSIASLGLDATLPTLIHHIAREWRVSPEAERIECTRWLLLAQFWRETARKTAETAGMACPVLDLSGALPSDSPAVLPSRKQVGLLDAAAVSLLWDKYLQLTDLVQAEQLVEQAQFSSSHSARAPQLGGGAVAYKTQMQRLQVVLRFPVLADALVKALAQLLHACCIEVAVDGQRASSHRTCSTHCLSIGWLDVDGHPHMQSWRTRIGALIERFLCFTGVVGEARAPTEGEPREEAPFPSAESLSALYRNAVCVLIAGTALSGCPNRPAVLLQYDNVPGLVWTTRTSVSALVRQQTLLEEQRRPHRLQAVDQTAMDRFRDALSLVTATDASSSHEAALEDVTVWNLEVHTRLVAEMIEALRFAWSDSNMWSIFRLVYLRMATVAQQSWVFSKRRSQRNLELQDAILTQWLSTLSEASLGALCFSTDCLAEPVDGAQFGVQTEGKSAAAVREIAHAMFSERVSAALNAAKASAASARESVMADPDK